ncbi:hypothetical protein I79_014185 [Cricetulus griseus]|uniref:Uncharacterized protein n=1 Tax=Cricetulus griseus TaxID=10029 RepID=G3HTG0_CRIGR|nr:hypothetical protein I79_014185 [Cricetulus griseus]
MPLIPVLGETEAGGSLSSRTAWAAQRNPVSKNQRPHKKGTYMVERNAHAGEQP